MRRSAQKGALGAGDRALGGSWTTKVHALTDAIRRDKRRYRDRHLIENAFCCLKDFRRVATRYDRLAATFLSGVALATAIAFWL